MYYPYFGLKEAPFSISPNPAYLFMTAQHQEALAHLFHGVESDAGFVLLTGDIGTGKTTVCRRFLNNLPQNTEIAFILNPCLDGLELLQAICRELSIKNLPQPASLRNLTDCISDHLLSSHAKGINTVLLIDEAQQLNHTVLELIRLLTNLETDTQKLLKIILVGQPELNQVLARGDLKQLSQRITARYHMTPLSLKEVEAYIDFRLQTAGYRNESNRSEKLFPKKVIKQLFETTSGVPRLINVICDRALLGVYSQNAKVVTLKNLQKASKEVQGNYEFSEKKTSSIWKPILAICMALLVATALSFLPVTGIPISEAFSKVHQWSAYHYEQLVGGLKTTEADKTSPIVEEPKEDATEKSVAETKEQDGVEEQLIENVVEENLQPPPIKPLSVKPLPVIERYSEQEEALASLMSLVDNNIEAQNCISLEASGWRCQEDALANWRQFRKINRPAVIEMLGDNEEIYYSVVASIQGNGALVMTDQSWQSIPLITLGEQWNGSITYLWQPPSGFGRFIYEESPAEHISWLSQKFAIIDQQDKLLADQAYNEQLRQRIIFFQKDHGLKEDGKAGIETLLTLNEATGDAKTLDSLSFYFPKEEE